MTNQEKRKMNKRAARRRVVAKARNVGHRSHAKREPGRASKSASYNPYPVR